MNQIPMDTGDEVRKDTNALLAHYFGERMGTAFESGYGDETLPIYVHNAFLLLIDHIGQQKAKLEIGQILSKNSKASLNYE